MIEDRRGHRFVGKDQPPFRGRSITRDDHALLLITAVDQLKQKMCCRRRERQVANLIDDDHLGLVDFPQLRFQRVFFCRLLKRGEQIGRRVKTHGPPAFNGLVAKSDCQMRLTHTGNAEEGDVLTGVNPLQAGQFTDGSGVDRRLRRQIEIFQLLDRRQMRRLHSQRL